MKSESVDKHLRQLLKDPAFRKAYELEMQKLKIIKPIVGYRVKHGLSQRALARNIGVSQQHISKIEGGEFSNIATLEKILLYVGYVVRVEAIPIGKRLKGFKRSEKAA